MSVELGYTTGSSEAPSFEPIPAGWYHARIVETSQHEANSGNGAYLKVRIQVDGKLHPEVGERVLFDNLNLWNASDKASRIAQSTLESICRAIGFPKGHIVRDSAELHERLLQVRVVVQSDQERGTYNVVKGYRPADGPQERPATGPQATRPAAAAPARPVPTAGGPQRAGGPPWTTKS